MVGSTFRMGCAAALVATLALAQPVSAAPIAFDEAVRGDLSNSVVTPTQLAALDIGLNTFAGGIDCSGSNCDRDDTADNFRVILPAGLRITGITIRITDFFATTQLDAAGLFFADHGSLDTATGNFSQAFNGTLPTTSVFSGAADGAGDLVLSVREVIVNSTFPTTRTTWRYLVGITVHEIPATAVPEPASLALLSAGLLGLAASGRRRMAGPAVVPPMDATAIRTSCARGPSLQPGTE